jgi:hypothetical protein
MKDGAETDVDCGGGGCPACYTGLFCLVNSDCQSNTCVADPSQSGKSICAPPPPPPICEVPDAGPNWPDAYVPEYPDAG